MSQLNRGALVAGGVAVCSLAVLAYTLTRPTKPKKTRRAKKERAAREPKYTRTFHAKPLDIHFVMSNEEGFHAHVAADKKNADKGLKYGSQLVKLNDERVDNLAHEGILHKLMAAKVPITLVFRENKELEAQWAEAEQKKEEANAEYKQGKEGPAIDLQTQAIRLHPTNKVYYSNRVLMFLKTKEYERALGDCQKIRELDPLSLYVKGHYLRGLVLFNMEKYKYAASAFQTVVKMNPKFKKAEDRLHECETFIRKDREAQALERRRKSEELLASVLKNVQAQEDEKEAKLPSGPEPAEENPFEPPVVGASAPMSAASSSAAEAVPEPQAPQQEAQPAAPKADAQPVPADGDAVVNGAEDGKDAEEEEPAEDPKDDAADLKDGGEDAAAKAQAVEEQPEEVPAVADADDG